MKNSINRYIAESVAVPHRVFAFCGVFNTVLASAAVITGLYATKMSVIYEPLSRIALAAFGWLVTSGFLLTSLAMLAVAGVLHFGGGKHLSFSLGSKLLALVGILFIVFSICKINPNPAIPTITGLIHIAAAGAACGLFPLCCFLVAHGLAKIKKAKRLFLYTLATGILGVLALLIRIIPAWSQLFGVQELVGGTNALIWTGVISAYFLKSHPLHFPSAHRQPPSARGQYIKLPPS